MKNVKICAHDPLYICVFIITQLLLDAAPPVGYNNMQGGWVYSNVLTCSAFFFFSYRSLLNFKHIKKWYYRSSKFFFFLSDKEEKRHRVRIMMQIISMRMTKFFFSWILLATVQSNAPNSYNRLLYTYAHVYKIYFYFVILSSIENRSPYIPIHHSSDFYCVYIINVKPECCSRSSICLCCIQSGFATTKNTHIRTQHNRWWWLSQRPSFSFRLLFKLLLLDYFKIQLVLRLYEYGIITSE